jgi:hypothetical protein
MGKAGRENTPGPRKRCKAPASDPLQQLLQPIAQLAEAIRNYLAVPGLTREQQNKFLTGLKRLGLSGPGGRTGAVARPRGRPRKFDRDDIADVAKDLAKYGVTTLDDFVDRVAGTLELQGKPVPGETVLTEICKPVYLRAKGTITD